MIADLGATTGLIIDVRPNTGGDERIARTVAQYFANGPVVYAKRELRDATRRAVSLRGRMRC